MSNELDLLDATLDELADLPEWKPFPIGVHRCQFHFETKKNDKSVLTTYVTLKALETLELAKPTEDANLEPGAEVTIQYQLGNEIGQGKLKNLLASFTKHLGLPEKSSLRAIMTGAEGAEAKVATRIQSNKDKTQQYTDIVEISF